MKVISKIKNLFKVIDKEGCQIDESFLSYVLSKYSGITKYYPIFRVNSDEIVIYIPNIENELFPDRKIGLVFVDFGLKAICGRAKITEASILSCALGTGPLDMVIKLKIESEDDVHNFYEASSYAQAYYERLVSGSERYVIRQEEKRQNQQKIMQNIPLAWA